MPKALKIHKAPQPDKVLSAKVLGAYIRAKRTQSGLKLEDAALLCNVAKDTLSKIENGSGGVRLDNVLHVCAMLGVELYIKKWKEE